MSRNRCPSNNFITFSRLRAFTMAEITWRGGQSCERKFPKLSHPLPPKKTRIRHGAVRVLWSFHGSIHPFADVTGHGQISNFEIPAIENFDYVCASPQFYPPIRGGISVSGRIYIQIYIYISEERIQRAQILNYFARYDQRCPTRKKNKRVPMMVSRGW